MTRLITTTILAALLSLSCAAPPDAASLPSTQPAATTKPSERDWIGVYASTREIGGFAGTVLVLQNDLPDRIGYRMRSYSDVRIGNAIEQDELRGTCLIDGRTLYLPEAYGFMHDGKPLLLASITRYTLADINGRKVLMRDDALREFREQNKLYDYGILIKVKNQADLLFDLDTVEHPSIKLLYSNPGKSWNDPFLHGGNSR